MKILTVFTLLLTGILTLGAVSTQAQSARYYKWQGADRVICAQSSPGEGWKRLNGSFIKSDCSI